MYCIISFVRTIKAANSVCDFKYQNSLSRKIPCVFVLFVLKKANYQIQKISLSFEE